MKPLDVQLLQILIKALLNVSLQNFSGLKQWLYTHGLPWRGDICTLVTGHKKLNKSDQTQLQPTWLSVLVISPKGFRGGFYCDFVAVQSKIIFIIILLLLTEGCRFNLKCFARQENKSETHLPERICFHNTQEEVIDQVWNVWHAIFFFVPNTH